MSGEVMSAPPPSGNDAMVQRFKQRLNMYKARHAECDQHERLHRPAYEQDQRKISVQLKQKFDADRDRKKRGKKSSNNNNSSMKAEQKNNELKTEAKPDDLPTSRKRKSDESSKKSTFAAKPETDAVKSDAVVTNNDIKPPPDLLSAVSGGEPGGAESNGSAGAKVELDSTETDGFGSLGLDTNILEEFGDEIGVLPGDIDDLLRDGFDLTENQAPDVDPIKPDVDPVPLDPAAPVSEASTEGSNPPASSASCVEPVPSPAEASNTSAVKQPKAKRPRRKQKPPPLDLYQQQLMQQQQQQEAFQRMQQQQRAMTQMAMPGMPQQAAMNVTLSTPGSMPTAALTNQPTGMCTPTAAMGTPTAAMSNPPSGMGTPVMGTPGSNIGTPTAGLDSSGNSSPFNPQMNGAMMQRVPSQSPQLAPSGYAAETLKQMAAQHHKQTPYGFNMHDQRTAMSQASFVQNGMQVPQNGMMTHASMNPSAMGSAQLAMRGMGNCGTMPGQMTGMGGMSMTPQMSGGMNAQMGVGQMGMNGGMTTSPVNPSVVNGQLNPAQVNPAAVNSIQNPQQMGFRPNQQSVMQGPDGTVTVMQNQSQTVRVGEGQQLSINQIQNVQLQLQNSQEQHAYMQRPPPDYQSHRAAAAQQQSLFQLQQEGASAARSMQAPDSRAMMMQQQQHIHANPAQLHTSPPGATFPTHKPSTPNGYMRSPNVNVGPDGLNISQQRPMQWFSDQAHPSAHPAAGHPSAGHPGTHPGAAGQSMASGQSAQYLAQQQRLMQQQQMLKMQQQQQMSGVNRQMFAAQQQQTYQQGPHGFYNT